MDSSTAGGNKTSSSFFGGLTRWAPQKQQPESQPEPVQFSDDEPLITTSEDDDDSSNTTSKKVTIKAVTEFEAIAASESLPQFSVLVGLKAPSLSEEEALQSQQHAPIDLIAVLDVSGSMHGSKIALLKRAVNFVIDNLGPNDRLSVVSFSTNARRVFPLRRTTQDGREEAKIAVNSLRAEGTTNIVEGLAKGVRVLEERRHKNPISSIIFLSDGLDTCNQPAFRAPNYNRGPSYLHLLPSSIHPSNRKAEGDERAMVFPVYSFGFGTDHDPVAMHAISDESGGTFSFVESYEMVQDAFAGCIGGLLSVVVKDLRVVLRSASHGVVIKSIESGRYASEVRDEGFRGEISVGDLYADEEKKFLIGVSVPKLLQGSEAKTSLLDVTCSYHDPLSKEEVRIEADLVEIRRPEIVSEEDAAINLEVDRERNRIIAAQSIAEAQRMADKGDLSGARALLSNRRTTILDSVSGQAHDDLSLWLEAEIKEMESRMGDLRMYEKSGRAYALSSMSALDNQRATTRGRKPAVSNFMEDSSGGFDAYATPQMARMVFKSQMANVTEDEKINK